MPKNNWNIAKYSEHEKEIAALANESGLSKMTASLLYMRNIRNAGAAADFIDCSPGSFHSPFLLKDMDKAVKRICKAIDQKDNIIIFGDYDVDGVTSVSILYLYLQSKGAKTGYYIPNRIGEGYGASKDAIGTLAQNGADLIITVDTGTTATEEAEYAKSLGVDMIITDHHECHCELPDAEAVVNPMRADCKYPFKSLAGVGVVFKLICAIEKTISEKSEQEVLESMMQRFGDLVAIGTVADVMPVIGENRYIIRSGLEFARNTANKGLAALIEMSLSSTDKFGNKKMKKLTSTTVGYVIAPRINAAGRVSNATRAVELFLTDSDAEARQIATELCEMNRLRQKDENDIIEQAYSIIGCSSEKAEKIIVLDHDGWHNGVIGIVSSRITEHYNLPSILISFDGDVGKGSGRSIPGVNLVEALGQCSDLLVKFGGHELAAGLTIERSNLSEFKERINAYVSQKIENESSEQKIEIDYIANENEINLPNTLEILSLEPFGISNPVPIFLLEDATVTDVLPLSGGKHTKLLLTKNNITMTALSFGKSPAELGCVAGDVISVVFSLDINEFRGVQNAQLLIRDISFSNEIICELERCKQIYAEILKGGSVPHDCDIIPARNDFASVYLRLKQMIVFDSSIINYRTLSLHSCFSGSMNYVKLRFILDILYETGIINVTPIGDGSECALISLNTVKNKINIEKSSLFKRLKSRVERTS